MNVNMLLYWMYVVRLNAPQRCAWQNKIKKSREVVQKRKRKKKRTSATARTTMPEEVETLPGGDPARWRPCQ